MTQSLKPLFRVDAGYDARVEPTETATKGELTRQTVLDAAIVRFGTEGYRSTSVATIARAAGVGGTVPYAYFPNKESLFFAAVDHDAASLIEQGLTSLADNPTADDWREMLVFTLLGAVDDHPLARRLLAGLEPEVTGRVLEIPALEELRKVTTALLESDQLAGKVRADIDPTAIANGLVTLILSLLMSLVQIGGDIATRYADDVQALISAAIDPPRR